MKTNQETHQAKKNQAADPDPIEQITQPPVEQQLRATVKGVVLGLPGTGKTTMLKKLVITMARQGRRTLIVTPHDMEWETVPPVSLHHPHRMFDYKGARRIIYTDDTFAHILEHYRSGLLILDDCRHYLRDGLDRHTHQLLISCRQIDIDLFAVGHGFREVPPKFFTFATHFFLFRTADNITERKRVILNFDRMVQAQQRINTIAAENPYYYEIIEA